MPFYTMVSCQETSRNEKAIGRLTKKREKGAWDFLDAPEDHRIANTMKRSSKMDPEIDHEDDYYLLEAIAKDRPKESICQPRIQATKD